MSDSMFPTTTSGSNDILALRQAFTTEVKEISTESGVSYLVFKGKTGVWEFGSDKEDVKEDIIVINSRSFQHGWQHWVASQLLSSRFTSIMADLPMEPEPKPNKLGTLISAAEARRFQGRFKDDDSGLIVEFASCSYGGRQGVSKVISEVKAKAASGSDFLFPVCQLLSSSYEMEFKDGTKGTVYNPVFKILGWMDQDGNEEGVTQKIEATPEPVAEVAREEIVAEELVVVEKTETAVAAPIKTRRRRAAPAA